MARFNDELKLSSTMIEHDLRKETAELRDLVDQKDADAKHLSDRVSMLEQDSRDLWDPKAGIGL